MKRWVITSEGNSHEFLVKNMFVLRIHEGNFSILTNNGEIGLLPVSYMDMPFITGLSRHFKIWHKDRLHYQIFYKRNTYDILFDGRAYRLHYTCYNALLDWLKQMRSLDIKNSFSSGYKQTFIL